MSANFTEVFLRTDKYIILLICILLLSLFLRLFKLSETMSFIGDQGWFYLSARDMLLTGKIPLVGITSSHTWLHQGPYWTYILAFLFNIFSFNPVIPAHFTALMGVLSIYLIYKVAKEMFDKNTAIISTFLYAISPLIVINDRFPYHTTLIPFFTILLIYSLFKWVKGEMGYFVWAIIFLGTLYNFELATFSLVGVIILFLIFGFVKKKKWALNLINKKIILIALVGFSLTMLPILIYDVNNGLLQTFGFIVWILYKLSVIGVPKDSNTIQFLLENYNLLIYSGGFKFSLIFLFLSFLYFFYVLIRKTQTSYLVIGISFLLIFSGFITAGIPSQAYLPIFFPVIILITGIFLSFLVNKTKIVVFLIIFIFTITSFFYLLNNEYNTENAEFINRKEAVKKVVEFADGKPYNLVGKGVGSQFESFTMNYKYLLWYYYKSIPSKQDVQKKIYIEEKNGEILISKND